MKKVRFLHVPKTAGSSFTRCLSRIYGARYLKANWFTFRGENFQEDLERYHQLDPARRAALVMVTGHAPLVTGIEEIDALPTVTFLRDPVERTKSLCQHVSEGKSPRFYSAKDFDLDAFLDHLPASVNSQTRHLLGVRGLELPDLDPAAVAAQALDVLEHRLAAYGITEFFEESLLVFRKALGWKAWPVYISLNRKSTRRRLTFNERQIARIRAMNEIDILVYDAARARFEEHLREDAAFLRAEMRRFRVRQALATPLLAVYRVESTLRWMRNKRRARRIAPDVR